MDLPTMGALPGISTLTQTSDPAIIWGGERAPALFDTDCVIASSAVDAGNTPTTVLRAGLVLGRKTADGLLYQCDPTATDGTQNPVGILLNSISMLGASGSAENKDVGAQGVLAAGPVKASTLLVLGTALTSSDYEYLVRRLLFPAFTLDDDRNHLKGRADFTRQIKKAADYTITDADQGVWFIITAAANLTLPTPKVGKKFRMSCIADVNSALLSASSSDDIITDGDAGADSVTHSTASHKIGSDEIVECILDGSGNPKWFASNPGGTTRTIA